MGGSLVFVRGETWGVYEIYKGRKMRLLSLGARPTSWWSINVVFRAGHIYPIRRRFYLLPRNGKYSLPLRENCNVHGFSSLSLSLSLSVFISLSTYLSHAINNSACGRFLWLRNEEKTAAPALARVCLPVQPPMYCTTPNGIAPSRRGRIARYNGPLHNGIRTCDTAI